MKAAQLHGAQDLRVVEVEEPRPGPGEVKLEVAAAGICGTDLHVYAAPEAFRVTPPQILGHEFSGTVVETGDGVHDVAVGERAAVFPISYCGRCPACTAHRPFACRRQRTLGLSAPGGIARFVTVHASKLHVLPENVDLCTGALVEPMAVAWHAVDRSGVRAGQAALVAGAGPVGIGVWFALRARGVTAVLVSEPSASRRRVVAALGATVVDPAADDVVALAAALGDGAGVDVAFDAAGVGPALASAVRSLTPGGRLVVVALHGCPIELHPSLLVLREIEVVGSVAYRPETFDAVVGEMADGGYDTTGWVEDVGIDDVVDVIHALRAGTGTKVLVRGGA